MDLRFAQTEIIKKLFEIGIEVYKTLFAPSRDKVVVEEPKINELDVPLIPSQTLVDKVPGGDCTPGWNGILIGRQLLQST